MSEKAPDDSTHESEQQDANEASISTTPVRKKKVTVNATRRSIRHLRKCKLFEKLRKLRKTDSGEIDPEEYKTLYLSKESEYTSDDDYAQNSLLSRKDINHRERLFRLALQKLEFTVKEMVGDGSCFFRSVADQIYGDQEYHGTVRAQCMDYIDENKQYFGAYITGDFDFYVGRKRMERAYADHLEIQAVAELYNTPIEIYYYNDADPTGIHHVTNARPDKLPIEICFESKLRAKSIIQVSYHNDIHYNSLVILTSSVASQTKKLGKQELTSLPPANVESATSSMGIRTRRIRPRETKEKKKEANLATTKIPAKQRVREEHRPIGRELQESESTHKWMAAGLEAHSRCLKDALQGRPPYFYSSPSYTGPRTVSKATYASMNPFVSLTRLNIALPSTPAIPGTSAETSQVMPQKSSSSVRFHTPLETTPTKSDGKPLRSILKKTFYNRIFHPHLKKTSNLNRTSCTGSSSSNVAKENPRCDKNKIVKKQSQPMLAKESLYQIGTNIKSMKTLKKRGKEARKDMRKMEPASSSTSSESMPRLPCRRKPKKKHTTKSSSTEPRRMSLRLKIKRDSSSSGAAADLGSSSDDSD